MVKWEKCLIWRKKFETRGFYGCGGKLSNRVGVNGLAFGVLTSLKPSAFRLPKNLLGEVGKQRRNM